VGEGGAALPPASLIDLAGRQRRLSEWRDRILLCNFWATWCAPCREEIPLLMAAREKYASLGLEIVGIAIDNAPKVIEYAASFKISYPILLAEANGLDLMRALGNTAGGLPYTVVADRQGSVKYRKLGAFRQGDLDSVLGPMTRV
jgi:thiol-disulfide isomerase/thioredoxin